MQALLKMKKLGSFCSSKCYMFLSILRICGLPSHHQYDCRFSAFIMLIRRTAFDAVLIFNKTCMDLRPKLTGLRYDLWRTSRQRNHVFWHLQTDLPSVDTIYRWWIFGARALAEARLTVNRNTHDRSNYSPMHMIPHAPHLPMPFNAEPQLVWGASCYSTR